MGEGRQSDSQSTKKRFIGAGFLVLCLIGVVACSTNRSASTISAPRAVSSSPSLVYVDHNKESRTHKPNNDGGSFGFYVMGDIPYSEWEEDMLRQQIRQLNGGSLLPSHFRTPLLWMFHTGDIQKVQRSKCREGYYNHVRHILEKSKVPVLVTPGDNDWFDCPNRTEAVGFYHKYLGADFSNQWKSGSNMQRSRNNPELFAMVQDGILILSLNLLNVDANDEPSRLTEARLKMNMDWIHKHLKRHLLSIRGVIVLGHALRSPQTRPVFEALSEYFTDPSLSEEIQKMPVLYIHGDGHDWKVDRKLNHQLHWRHYADIQVDQGGYADPILVEVASTSRENGKMIPLRKQHENQVVVGRGLFRIDRQRGRYSEDFLTDFKASLSKKDTTMVSK